MGLTHEFGEGNGNPLQYSCLENPIDRGAWQVTVHGIEKSWTGLCHALLQGIFQIQGSKPYLLYPLSW